MSATSNKDTNESGRHHWVAQRVTAVVMVPLTVWFVFTVIGLSGSSYQEVVSHFDSSWRISLMAIFVACVFYHGYLGLQVVIEDYVADTSIRAWAVIAARYAAILFAVVGIVSALRIGV